MSIIGLLTFVTLNTPCQFRPANLFIQIFIYPSKYSSISSFKYASIYTSKYSSIYSSKYSSIFSSKYSSIYSSKYAFISIHPNIHLYLFIQIFIHCIIHPSISRTKVRQIDISGIEKRKEVFSLSI